LHDHHGADRQYDHNEDRKEALHRPGARSQEEGQTSQSAAALARGTAAFRVWQSGARLTGETTLTRAR